MKRICWPLTKRNMYLVTKIIVNIMYFNETSQRIIARAINYSFWCNRVENNHSVTDIYLLLGRNYKLRCLTCWKDIIWYYFCDKMLLLPQKVYQIYLMEECMECTNIWLYRIYETIFCIIIDSCQFIWSNYIDKLCYMLIMIP